MAAASRAGIGAIDQGQESGDERRDAAQRGQALEGAAQAHAGGPVRAIRRGCDQLVDQARSAGRGDAVRLVEDAP